MKKLCNIFITLLTLFLCLTSGVLAQSSALPESYDLRNVDGKNYVTEVKRQVPWGTCWSFASNAVAETSALLKGASADLNLSERSLAWFATRMQKNQGAPDSTYEGYYTISSQGVPQGIGIQTWAAFNTGGGPYFSLSQFASWYGSNTEEMAPYRNNENLETDGVPSMQGTWTLPYNMIYDQEVHLQNGENCLAISSPGPNGTGTINNSQPEVFAAELKQALYEHGALLIGYGYAGKYDNTTTGAYYNYDCVAQPDNHAVTVVGWDDNYPASNFNTTPPGNGAYIVKNSWGTDYDNDGYFYLSYYDQSIASYCWMDVETPDISGGYSYDNIYQYDLLGAKNDEVSKKLLGAMENSGLTPGDVSTASIFTTDHNETLRAVSAFNPIKASNVDYSVSTDISVYVLNENYTSPTDGELVATGTTSFENYGIHTVKFDTPVELPEGTTFSVVETQVITEMTSNGTVTAPLVSVEYGFEEPALQPLQGPDGQDLGFALQSAISSAQPGQSFIHGLNGDSWDDVTSDAVVNSNAINFTVATDSSDGGEFQNRTTIGNALIKAYTTDNEVVPPTPMQPEVDTINVIPEQSILSTLPGNTNSTTVTVNFEPENAYVDTDNLFWYVTPNVVDMQVDPSNTSVTLTAKAEGYAVLECTNGAQIGMAVIQVSDQKLMADSIEVTNNSPDSFDIAVKDVKMNPAFNTPPIEADSVSLFSWSETNQSDLNAKLVHKEDGSNDFILRDVPVNDTDVNNYFLNADNIIINAYANSGSETYWLGNTRVSWVDGDRVSSTDLGNKHFMTYIAYGQNVGFVKPSVFVPDPDASNGSSIIGNPNSKHLEGIRVSSNMEGIKATTSVYSQGLGWIEGQDGQYTGTMWENRPIEAVRMNISGDLSFLEDLVFVYRAYIDGQGWTDWTTNNNAAGIPNSGKPILAIELTFQHTQ